MGGWENITSQTWERCWDYLKIVNQFGPFDIPEWLKMWILEHSYNGLLDLKENIIIQNQFKTYISSILHTNVDHVLRKKIVTTIVDSLLDVWDKNESSNEPNLQIDFSDEEYMDTILYDAVQEYENDGWSIPNTGFFSVNGILYDYSHFWENIKNWEEVIIGDEQTEQVQKKQSITEYLDEKWLPESTKKIIETIFMDFYGTSYFSNFSEEEKNKIYSNFSILIKYIVAIESYGWKYVVNSKWSSAKAPFQYLDGFIEWKPTQIPKKDKDGKKLLDEKGNEILMNAYSREEERYSPFDTGLRRNMLYYASKDQDYQGDYYNYEKYKDHFPEYIKNGWEKQPNFSPLDFTQEESINFWLLDSFINGNTKNKSFFIKILISWDISAVKDFYSIIHHTKPTKNTQANMIRNEWILKWLVIAVPWLFISPRPKLRPEKSN